MCRITGGWAIALSVIAGAWDGGVGLVLVVGEWSGGPCSLCGAPRSGGWFGGAGGVAMWDGSRDIWSQIYLLIPLKFNK